MHNSSCLTQAGMALVCNARQPAVHRAMLCPCRPGSDAPLPTRACTDWMPRDATPARQLPQPGQLLVQNYCCGHHLIMTSQASQLYLMASLLCLCTPQKC